MISLDQVHAFCQSLTTSFGASMTQLPSPQGVLVTGTFISKRGVPYSLRLEATEEVACFYVFNHMRSLVFQDRVTSNINHRPRIMSSLQRLYNS